MVDGGPVGAHNTGSGGLLTWAAEEEEDDDVWTSMSLAVDSADEVLLGIAAEEDPLADGEVLGPSTETSGCIETCKSVRVCSLDGDR